MTNTPNWQPNMASSSTRKTTSPKTEPGRVG
jgi:hypothetical protein